MVHAILLARLSPTEAEDQVQEVFLVAWKKLGQLDDAAGVRRLARRHRAQPRHRLLSAASADRSAARTLPDEQRPSSSDVAEVRHVLDAIRSLPEAYQETLVMRLCEGMSGPEIAAVTGLEPGSVRINLHRGMKLLRDKLGVDGKVAAS